MLFVEWFEKTEHQDVKDIADLLAVPRCFGFAASLVNLQHRFPKRLKAS